jgi:CBS domain-containing protein
MLRKLLPDIVNNQRLVELPPEATVREAVQRMARQDVRSSLVTKNGGLIGIFTGTDLISRVVGPGLDPNDTPLERVMTKNPQTISADETAIEALRRMQAGHFRHLPVVKNGKVVGILSRGDFCGCELDEIERQERIWEEM